MAVASFYPNTYSGGTYKRSSSWATARANNAASTETQIQGTGQFNVVNAWLSWVSSYDIVRQHAHFDTSSLGAGATINSATLYLTMLLVDPNTRSMHVCKSTKSVSAAIAITDHASFGATSFGSTDTSTTGNKTITINASGLAEISKTGITPFAIIGNKDFANTTPTDYDGNTGVGAGNHATEATRLRLEIDYTPASTTNSGFFHFM